MMRSAVLACLAMPLGLWAQPATTRPTPRRAQPPVKAPRPGGVTTRTPRGNVATPTAPSRPSADRPAPVTPPLRLRVAADRRAITLLIEGPIPEDGAVRIERRAGETILQLDPPLRAERDAVRAVQLLGPELFHLMRLTSADRELDAIRRLHVDPEVSAMLSTLSPEIGHVAGRRWTDTSVTPGAAYEYRAQVVDAAGAPVGAPASVRVAADPMPVPPPVAVSTVREKRSVRVRWRLPDGADGSSAVVAFQVRRRIDTLAVPLTDDPVMRTRQAEFSLLDPEPMLDQRVRYEVVAIDLAGRQSVGASTDALVVSDRVRPMAPPSPAVRDESDAVQLAWSISPEPDVVGYRVERATGTPDRFAQVGPRMIPRDTPEFRDTTAIAGAQYFYRVFAVDRAGLTSEPTTSLSAVPFDRTPPDSGRSLAVEVDARAVRLTWQPSPSADVRGYAVYRGEQGFPTVRLTSTSVARRQFVDSIGRRNGPQAGRRFVYEVAAVDRVGNESPRMRAEIATPDVTPPGPVRALAAVVRPDGTAEVAWTAPGDLDVRAYQILRDGLRLSPVSALSTLRLVDTLVVGPAGVEYEVRAVDADGNLGPPVRQRAVPVDRTPPSPTRDARARLSAAGVVLTWEPVIDPALAGYVVYRALPGSTALVRVTPRPIQGSTFTDAAGRPGAQYLVRAVDVAGNESLPGPRVIVPAASSRRDP